MAFISSSLSSRVGWLGAFVSCAMLALVGMLLGAGAQMQAGFQWVSHTQQVIQTIDETMADMREAESGQRGFLLTRDPSYARTFDRRTVEAGNDIVLLGRLTGDNPIQARRVAGFQATYRVKLASLRTPMTLAHQQRFAEAIAVVASGRGRNLMDEMARRADEMKQEERDLLAIRLDAADRQAAWNRDLVAIGGPAIVGMLLLFVILLIRSIRRPIRSMLSSMSAFGSGDLKARVEDAMGTTEFELLARAYNRMADRLDVAGTRQAESDIELQNANIDLRRQSDALQARGNVIEMLGGMAHRMQAARTDEELAAVIHCFVPRVLPDLPGALYAHNNSRNLLVRLARWADPIDTPETFSPEDCWGLRRGQSHFIAEPGHDVVCAHVDNAGAIYHCEPLLAGGEVIGMLYLQGVVETESRFRLTVLTENIASALLNHRLQRGLREQTIRDPLTGLFNRRYMEEALALEIARASRGQTPLSLVMCDVDHFKRFNDEFGHDAGDALLRAVSAEMRNHFRDGDVVCRYGGEEFTIIAPAAEPPVLALRVEKLRTTIAELSVRHNGQALGAISMSFGIAGWNAHMARDGSTLIQVADAALYRAKRNGRNQIMLGEQPGPLALAAE